MQTKSVASRPAPPPRGAIRDTTWEHDRSAVVPSDRLFRATWRIHASGSRLATPEASVMALRGAGSFGLPCASAPEPLPIVRAMRDRCSASGRRAKDAGLPEQ